MSKMWRRRYKCRLCGASYLAEPPRSGVSYSDRPTAIADAWRTRCVHPQEGGGNRDQMLDVHDCASGHLGIADLQGFEMFEEMS